MSTPVDQISRSVHSIDSKRLFDVIGAAVCLVVVAVPFLLLALVVRLTSRGPVFYRQTRVGRLERPFRIFKFRTMVADADRQGPGITAGDDPRITRVGRFLRHTKLDELPQLLNVLKGEMSFVGPRPEAPKYVAHYTPEQREVLTIRPGITGWTQLTYRHEEELLSGVIDVDAYYIQQIMPAKLECDLAYVRSYPSLWTDLKTILRTITAVLRQRKIER